MGEVSAISWTDATLEGVDLIVAVIAERGAVRDIEAKLRVVSERLDVVCSEDAVTAALARLTSELVPHENVIAPAFVLKAESFAAALSNLTVLVGWMGGAAWRPLAGDLANLLPRFQRMALAEPVARPVPRCFAHLAPGFGAHYGALHHGH